MLRISLRNDLAEIERVEEAALRFLQERGMDRLRLYRSRLVLEESLANVIRHGCNDGLAHEIAVEVHADDGEIRIRVIDDGRPFDPSAAPPFDAAAPLEARSGGGMGIHLLRGVSRHLSYERRDGRNRLEVML